MGLRKLRYEKDDVLRKKTKPVKEFNKRLHDLIDDLVETMHNHNGLGLAAIQVGILKRVAVIDAGDGLIELVNPEIIEVHGQQERKEGCLSIPGQRGVVLRPAKVVVKAFDRYGIEKIIEGEELLAVALCHEIDHLDGILYTDKVAYMCSDEEDQDEEDD